jgi:hypothetical protein
MQLVYEFGAREVGPVVRVIHGALGDVSYSVKCLPNDSDTYTLTDDLLESVATKLQRGEIASFSLHPSSGLVRYALATCPSFDGQPLSLYLGTIEYTGNDYEPLWTMILSAQGLTVACVGFEEGVEIGDDKLSVASFPWSQWPLVIGAVRDPSASQPWTIKHGPEMRWFSKGGG